MEQKTTTVEQTKLKTPLAEQKTTMAEQAQYGAEGNEDLYGGAEEHHCVAE